MSLDCNICRLSSLLVSMLNDSPPAKSALKSRVLLISHNFPPTQGPESALVRLNTLDLLRRGWQVSVLTTTMDHIYQGMDQTMLDGLPPELEVIRTPSYDAVIRRRWPRVARVVMTVLRRWVLPEVFLLWLFSSVPAGKRWLQKHGPAILYSRATKHVSNVTGWYLKRATGLPWVAHFSDPWIERHLNGFQRWFARQFESRIIRDADALVFVTKKLADRVLRSYPSVAHKTHIIPHGYAPLVGSLTPVKGAGQRPLQALHAGSFIPGYRDPANLLAGLALLNQRLPLQGCLLLTFVGQDTTVYQPQVEASGLAGVVRLLSSVPFEQCQQMIGQSDLLLVLDTPGYGGIFLPTKLIEYLPYEKPVLGLTEPDSVVHELLRESNQYFADLDSPEDIAAVFERLLLQWQTGVWEISTKARSCVLEYRIDRVNVKLDDLLNSLAAKLPKNTA